MGEHRLGPDALYRVRGPAFAAPRTGYADRSAVFLNARKISGEIGVNIRGYSWAGAPTSDFDRACQFFREDLGIRVLVIDDELVPDQLLETPGGAKNGDTRQR